MTKMWQAPFGPTAGWLPEFSVGTTRYLSHYLTGEVDVAAEHVAAARQSGFIPVDHPEAVAARQARGG